MNDTMTTATIEADPTVPIIRVTRDFAATPAQLFRAHTDPELFARWVGPDGMTITLDRSSSSGGVASRRAASSPAAAGSLVGRVIAADDGSFRSSVTIPPGTEPGLYSLVSATGSKQLGTIALQVGTSGARAVSGLPFSGAEVLPGVFAGSGLIVAGGLLLIGVQYRRSRIA